MEGIGWIVLIILVLIFGKNIPFIANLEGGTFNQPNAVPTPDGIAATTIQNQNSPPENQPAPWKNICQVSPVAQASLPFFAIQSAPPSVAQPQPLPSPSNRISLSSVPQY